MKTQYMAFYNFRLIPRSDIGMTFMVAMQNYSNILLMCSKGKIRRKTFPFCFNSIFHFSPHPFTQQSFMSSTALPPPHTMSQNVSAVIFPTKIANEILMCLLSPSIRLRMPAVTTRVGEPCNKILNK